MINKSQIMIWRNIGYDAQELICQCDSNASVEKLAEMAEAIRGKMNSLDISELKKLHIAEYCKPEERHIISVFKMIQDLLAPATASSSKTSTSKQGKQTQFQMLMQRLPDTHKAKWFAGAALNTSEQAMQSVLSTALSRLNAFLDSEMEQILCFDTAIDAEKFCNILIYARLVKSVSAEPERKSLKNRTSRLQWAMKKRSHLILDLRYLSLIPRILKHGTVHRLMIPKLTCSTKDLTL